MEVAWVEAQQVASEAAIEKSNRQDSVKAKLEALGLSEPDLLSSENRKYVNTLPSDYKNKALRYLDIFRENPEVVSEYLDTLKKFGNEKAAKDAGATNILFYPNKVAIN